jgi:hypothetical protein
MDDSPRCRYLGLALRAVGLVFSFGDYPLARLWPSGSLCPPALTLRLWRAAT